MTQEPSTLKHVLFLRTTFAFLLLLLFAIGGFLAYNEIIKEALPDLAIPQATVLIEWPGAESEAIEQSITKKVEIELKSLKGLKQLRSASFNSFCIIAVEFRSKEDITEALPRLRAKVLSAESQLPKGAEKPRISVVSTNDAPILNLALYGDLDQAIISRKSKELKDRIEQVRGVNKVSLGGRRKEVVIVQIDRFRAQALGISTTTIRDRIQEANIDMPWGQFENVEAGAVVSLFGKFRDLNGLKELPITRLPGGRPVRLDEVADVRIDLERETSRASLSWKGESFNPAVELSVTKSSGADTIGLIKKIRQILEEKREGSHWPHGLDYQILIDQQDIIKDQLDMAFTSGWQAMIGVFVVLLLMLTWREALLAGICIPITFLGSLLVIWALGFSMNVIVIVGMVLSLGLLVDVFILMLEGLHDEIYIEGQSFSNAALATVKKFALPAFSGQLTTILALAPLLAIPGVMGKFIRVMPATAIICLVCSYIVALFVCIPLARYFFSSRAVIGSEKTFVDQLTQKVTSGLFNFILKTTLKNRFTAALTIIGFIGLFIIAMNASSSLKSAMSTPVDGRKLGITVELPPNTPLEISQECADRVGENLRERSYFESIIKLVGKKSPFALTSLNASLSPTEDKYLVGFSCIFTPKEERDKMSFEYLDELRDDIHEVLARYPGSQLVLVPEMGMSSGEDPIQVDLIGNDMTALRSASKHVREILADIPGTSDVKDNLGPSRTETRMIPRIEALNFYGMNVEDLASQGRLAMVDDEIGKFPAQGTGEDLEIRLGTAWPSRQGNLGGPQRIDEFALLYIISPEGKPISLASVAEFEIDEVPLSITHKNGLRTVTVSSGISGRTSGEILSELLPALNTLKTKWKSGMNFDIAGEAAESAETFGSAGLMFIIAMILVFSVLSLQFDSFRQSLIILTAVPLALIGTIAGFYFTHTTFTFMAMVGIISLIGIVVNDSIVMITVMNQYRQNGEELRESAAHGAADRLRPILSTSLTTIAGLVPLYLSSPDWKPLCIAIIYGLIAATFTSIIANPCLYFLLHSSKQKTVHE